MHWYSPPHVESACNVTFLDIDTCTVTYTLRDATLKRNVQCVYMRWQLPADAPDNATKNDDTLLLRLPDEGCIEDNGGSSYKCCDYGDKSAQEAADDIVSRAANS